MRDPHAPRWCIRWHSLPKTTLSYGGLLPESWDTRAKALAEKKWLERTSRTHTKWVDCSI
jgi:hypothetical protein